MRLCLLALLLFCASSLWAQEELAQDTIVLDPAFSDEVLIADSLEHTENKKLVALLLTATLGPFGVHRLYLGTHQRVPFFYTLTLGGGLGVLPMIDFIAIAFSKDLSRYENNSKVIMWLGKSDQ